MGLGWMLWPAFVYATERRPRESWSRERLVRHQEVALRRLLRHRAPLQALPSVDKSNLMSRFDHAVTDPRLRLDDLKRHLEHAGKEELYLGKYLVMSTSGSSGVRGIFPFTRKAVAPSCPRACGCQQ
jgi:phenylacetate-CoA ligase